MKKYRPRRYPLLPRRQPLPATGPALPLQGPWPDWPAFWRDTSAALQQRGYARSTLLYYRQILRAFSQQAAKPPAAITREDVHAYLHRLARSRPSAHWIAMNISILRTLFDKLTGQGLLHRITGPRLPRTLPDILTTTETEALLNAANTLRDQLLIHLLLGHGLKPSTLRHLRWHDLDCMNLQSEISTLQSTLMRIAKGLGLSNDLVFPGLDPAKPLSARSIERRIRELATAAGIERPVTAMTLRHTFAVVSLRNGMSLPELQQRLGHKTLEATARYLRCLLPHDATSPLDTLAQHDNSQARVILDVLQESSANPIRHSEINNLQLFRFLKMRLKSGFLRLASCLLGT
ncbi:MAG: tyrosine-type recombinase/integrase [Verrucomicrobia bacterium]|nr:tyrosine-type recombinase/integrase [Verrucomicrobiota bacterium]